jgi:hypothetical protein
MSSEDFVENRIRNKVLKYIRKHGIAVDDEPELRFTTSHNVGREKHPWEVYIYGLADPRDHVIRYVGKTVKPLYERATGHMNDPTNARMAEWVESLDAANIAVEIVALEICTPKTWEMAERKWISRMRRIGTILNLDRGGIRGSQRGRKSNYKGTRTPAGPVRILTKDEIAKLNAELLGKQPRFVSP